MTTDQPEPLEVPPPRRKINHITVMRGAALAAAEAWIARLRFYNAHYAAASEPWDPHTRMVKANQALEDSSIELPAPESPCTDEEKVWYQWVELYADIADISPKQAEEELRTDWRRYYQLLSAMLRKWREVCPLGETPYDEIFDLLKFLCGEMARDEQLVTEYYLTLHQAACPSCAARR